MGLPPSYRPPRTLLGAEQHGAWLELWNAPRAVHNDALCGFAAHARDVGGLPLEHPDPLKIARANEFDVCPDAGLALAGLYVDNCVHYRPRACRRAQGFVIYHEVAHGLLDRARRRCGLYYTHGDVQTLMLYLMLAPQWLAPRLRQYGPEGTARLALRAHRHAPPEFLRLRVQLAWAARVAAVAG